MTNPPKGDRILYVEGRNNNEMQVRPASLLLQALVPVMIEAHDCGAGDLLCRYTYSDVKFNVGLTETDFTPESIGLKRN